MFKSRLQIIRQKLVKEKLDAVLISDVSNVAYLSGYSNFSKQEREAYIFIGSDFAYLISDERYAEEVKAQVLHFSFFERSHKNPMENLFKKHKIKNLGIEENNLTVVEHKFIKKQFENTKHFEVSRSIKTKEEINKVVKACKIGDLAFEYILGEIEVGISEKEIAGKLENFIRNQGAVISFPPIVAFDKNSSVPHHQTREDVLTEGIILLDFGVKIENYCSDMTRTVFLGEPSKQQKKMYEAVLNAQKKTVDAIESGERKTAKLFLIANEHLKSQGFPAIPHSLGHGVGLEIHEYPSLFPKSKGTLKEGMVFSIEPGIYIPGFGGVRIEDLFLLQKGLRRLTKSSQNLIVI